MKPTFTVPAAVFLLGIAGSVGADEAAVTVGARVRFRAPFSVQRVDGKVLALDEQWLTLKLRGVQDPMVFARSSIQTLEVRRPGKRLKGAFIGLMVGTAIGTLAARSRSYDFWEFSSYETLYYAIYLGLPCAVAGAVAAPGARWEMVTQGAVRLSIAPRRDRGVEARLTVQF